MPRGPARHNSMAAGPCGQRRQPLHFRQVAAADDRAADVDAAVRRMPAASSPAKAAIPCGSNMHGARRIAPRCRSRLHHFGHRPVVDQGS